MRKSIFKFQSHNTIMKLFNYKLFFEYCIKREMTSNRIISGAFVFKRNIDFRFKLETLKMYSHDCSLLWRLIRHCVWRKKKAGVNSRKAGCKKNLKPNMAEGEYFIKFDFIYLRLLEPSTEEHVLRLSWFDILLAECSVAVFRKKNT